MSGTRKRRGTTLVELSLVIAILAMIALPFATFVSQNLTNTVQSSTQLKEQMVLEQVMQDMEKHLRSAVRTPSRIEDPLTPNRIEFYSVDAEALASNLPKQTLYKYSLADGLLTKSVDTASATFPDGLEAGMITSMTFPEGNLDPTNPPCYITVLLEAGTTAPEKTVLRKTIYLRNYTSTVSIVKILGVTVPRTGDFPVTTITPTTQYTGIVAWTPALPVGEKFKNATEYTATITVAPIGDYTLTGVAADFFTVAGATTVTNLANSGVVTATFPAIGATQLAIAAPTMTLSKPYDGNTTAAVTAGALSGVVSPDVVTVSAVATYDTAAVGMGKTITVVYTLGGAQAGNYIEPVSYTATGAITTKAITVTATSPSKTYGTALTAGTSTTNFTAGATWVGSEVITSVTLTPDAAGLSATTAAGAAYIVTPSEATGTGGFVASNYTITYTAYNGTVSAKPLTIAAPTALTLSKPYDGNTTAAVTAGALSGVVSPDVVTASAVATYDTAAVGTSKTITVVYSLAGTDAARYVKPIDYTVTGTITAKPLTVTTTAGQSKIYGAADPTFAYTFAPALVGSDVMSGALSRATGESVGTYAITQGTLTAGTNYTITFVSSTFSVTAKSITVTATGPTKVYGAALTTGTSATNFTASGAIAGETVTSVTLTPNAAGLSATTAAGAAYVVTPSLATGSGGFLASNYTIAYTAYNGTVAAAPLTAIGAITGTPQVGQTLTAGTVTPSGATTTHRWQSATTSGGTYADITGATGTTYTLAAGDLGKYIKVVATGTGNYTGTVTSAATGVITLSPINMAAIRGVTVPVQSATPVTTITATAQYTGTVTWSPALTGGGDFKNQTVYTATITIIPNPGYTLTGVTANFFTVFGTTVHATNDANSGVVKAIFPTT